MKEFTETEFWLAIGFSFVVGYVLVSFIARLMKTEPPPPAVNPVPVSPQAVAPDSTVLDNDAARHLLVLGLTSMPPPEELAKVYREEIAKYHADNARRLDDDFRRLARQKTFEIETAYAFLRGRHDQD